MAWRDSQKEKEKRNKIIIKLAPHIIRQQKKKKEEKRSWPQSANSARLVTMATPVAARTLESRDDQNERAENIVHANLFFLSLFLLRKI